MPKNLLVVICGPTATGKTALGIKVAKNFNGELISADSRQVYQGMDIGTGKDHPKETVIHLIDFVNPNEQFSVADYVKLATKTIEKIWERGKLPILVGGTGLYLKGIVEGIETMGIPPDWQLRKKLQNYTVSQLQRLLEETCPERLRGMNKSDRNNPRRLVRAIEIALNVKCQMSNVKFTSQISNFSDFLMIGLKAPNKVLYQRIDKRVEERVKKGVVEEIKQLLKKGYSWENSVLRETIGYKEFKPYFEGKAGLEEVVQRWKFEEHSYARRQMTWFKKEKRIHWFDITRPDFEKEVAKLIRKWYSENDA